MIKGNANGACCNGSDGIRNYLTVITVVLRVGLRCTNVNITGNLACSNGHRLGIMRIEYRLLLMSEIASWSPPEMLIC
jgi:hypothetical protein